ncbi:non-ribosomal peptide synthetase (plasmid) [Streptomyces sp. NBC_00984]|uniref:non-ribosomal peptide synthetase n=1 Tax=Streptomyces sp. NBC_00984 TaxID=2903700 RepID=UPI002F90F6FA|nr:non-ribosomal peptide synthetase [Streptomyces sp. NBC_00984]
MGLLRGAATPYPADSTIPERFAEQTRARPGEAAVVDGAHSLTYAELDRRSDQLAHLLRERGVGDETRVGVLLDSGHEMITALLAVLKAGGAYVPVNPGYPRRRQDDMLADAGASVVVRAQDVRAAGARDTDGGVEPVAGPRSLAYVLFTSGSTGRPKGVMIEHRSVLRLVCGGDVVPLGPDERIAQVADPSFDAFTYEVWGALLNGATLVVVPREVVLAPGELKRTLDTHRITTLILTSALFTEVMADRPDSFGGLRNLVVGGDVLNVARARLLTSGAPADRPDRFVNGYGPTETTVFAVRAQVDTVPADATAVPIGGPVANTSCYVLDQDLKPVPDGTTGELFIGGPGVGRGYVGRPDETRERFLPDPFADEDRAVMYRTGDLVTARADGTLDFAGRADHQVKIRGYRVEPGEVEAVLTTHPGIRQAAVTVDESTGDRRLVAHVVPAATDGAPDGLREFLAGTLPEWMIPAAFLAMPQLPLTVAGKVDRLALQALPVAAPDAGAEAPRTDLERRLAATTADILGLASVGLTDDFFALGGHSLLAMRLVSRVNDTFDADVDLGEFLYDPTVLRLAAEVSRER